MGKPAARPISPGKRQFKVESSRFKVNGKGNGNSNGKGNGNNCGRKWEGPQKGVAPPSRNTPTGLPFQRPRNAQKKGAAARAARPEFTQVTP
jgi:hypothetical protein